MGKTVIMGRKTASSIPELKGGNVISLSSKCPLDVFQECDVTISAVYNCLYDALTVKKKKCVFIYLQPFLIVIVSFLTPLSI